MKLENIPLTAFILLLAGVLYLQSCKKDEKKGPDCNLPNADLSYTLNMKGIIDQYCVSCHAGTGPGPDDYRTYEGIKPHLDEGHVLDRVVITKDMPQGGGLSQAQRDSINCWIAAGYPK